MVSSIYYIKKNIMGMFCRKHKEIKKTIKVINNLKQNFCIIIYILFF